MKNWHVILGCLLVSSAIWLVMNLSRSAVELEDVPVLAVSNIDGYSTEAVSAVSVAARCRASGFKLIGLGLQKEAVKVVFNASDFRKSGKNSFTVDNETLYRYVSDIFGDGVSVESFITRDPEFTFEPVRFRKVPVTVMKNISYRSEFTAVGDIRCTPDSVLVYGSQDAVSSIDAVYTEPVEKKNVRKNVRGVARLEVPEGVRLSAEVVEYLLPVERYVEMKTPLNIRMRGLPSGIRMSFFPPQVDVYVKCKFPVKSDVFDNAYCYVDYSEYAESRTGKCIVRVSGLPSDIIEYKVVPEVCSCLSISM